MKLELSNLQCWSCMIDPLIGPYLTLIGVTEEGRAELPEPPYMYYKWEKNKQHFLCTTLPHKETLLYFFIVHSSDMPLLPPLAPYTLMSDSCPGTYISCPTTVQHSFVSIVLGLRLDIWLSSCRQSSLRGSPGTT